MHKLGAVGAALIFCGSSALSQDIGDSADVTAGLGTFLSQQEAAPSPDAPLDRTEIELKDLVFRNVLDRAYPLMAVRWKTRSIAVCWENPEQGSDSDRALVKRAVEESWSAHSALVFTGWQKCASNNRGIRILIQDAGPHTAGLGTRVNGKPNGMRLNFSFRNWGASCRSPEARRQQCIYTISVHEFGHAIGFAHEQNRPDTPDDDCFARRVGSSGDTTQLTPWDGKSVMNYCNPVFGNNGRLSDLDIFAVSKIYPKT